MKFYKMKKKYLYVLITLTASMLSGCGDKRQEISSYGNQETIATATDAANEYDTELEEVEWNEVYSFGNNHINIDASFIDRSSMTYSVIKRRKREFTSEDKMKYLQKLSDGAIYYGEFEYMPKKVLEAYVEKAKRRYNEAELNGNSSEILEGFQSDIKLYTDLYMNAPEDFITADSYEGDNYIIEKHNVLFRVMFKSEIMEEPNPGAEEKIYLPMISMEPFSGYDAMPEYFKEEPKDCEYYTDIIWGGNYDYGTLNNECTLSAEEIEKEVQSFLDSMGFGGFEIVRLAELAWYKSEEGGEKHTLGNNGCRVYLVSTWKDISLDYISPYMMEEYDEQYDEVYTNYYAYGPEMIQIDIDDRGIIRLNYSYPMTEAEVVSDNTEILDAQAVKASFFKALSDGIPEDAGIVANYDKIEFAYLYYMNPDDLSEVTAVPAYAFYTTDFSGRIFVINAIDGTSIY